MKSPLLIFVGIGFGLAIFFFAQWKCTDKRWEKKYTASEADYKSLFDSITNAPVERDTVHDTIRLRDPYIVKIPVPVIHVDSTGDSLRSYSGYERGDNYLINWRVIVSGELKSINVLPGSYIRNSEITIKKNIIIPERTNVEIPPFQRQPRFSLWALLDAGISRRSLHSIDVGIMVQHRKGWGIFYQLGYDNDIYHKFGLGLKLK